MMSQAVYTAVAASAEAPTFDVDLFSDDVLRHPYDVYTAMRAAGPVIWLSRHECYALPRYADVKRALEDHDTFISGQGVGLSEFGNKSRLGTPIASDGALHKLVRGVVADRLSLRAIRDLTPEIQAQADDLVAEVLARGTFDGVSDFSRRFPLMVMADLIGLPEDGREHILDWADAGFNLFGPANERTARSMPKFPALIDYIRSLEKPGRLRPGSMGAAIYEAADAGRLTFAQCGPLMVSYLMAGLDTTINAISAALMLFGQNPDQWDAVRANPRLLGTAFNEVIRVESPIQNLRRVASRDCTVEGVAIPGGASVLMMYGSANRDERQWPHPTRFDATRNPIGHVAFGTGIHNCPGQILARLETVALLTGLVKHVRRIEVGAPVWHLNNVIHGLHALPVKLQA
jgi:cytochrome P450